MAQQFGHAKPVLAELAQFGRLALSLAISLAEALSPAGTQVI